MHGDNKRVKDSESLIVQYDDHYADIPLARINEAETLDDYILLPVIDHRQYDHSTHCAELVIHSMCNCKYDFDYDSLRGYLQRKETRICVRTPIVELRFLPLRRFTRQVHFHRPFHSIFILRLNRRILIRRKIRRKYSIGKR